jgi:hypothetical protein
MDGFQNWETRELLNREHGVNILQVMKQAAKQIRDPDKTI